MNRFRCRMVPAFALMLAAACSGDSFTDVQGDLERLLAEPTQLFIEVGESKQVVVEGVDASGNPITANYEVTAQGAGIDIRRDSTFLPIYVDDSTLQVPAEAERFRFIVTGTAYGATEFTVSAGGQDVVIPVQVVPQTTLEAAISNQAPALGETITITAPAGTHFSATSVVTQPDPAGAQPFVVSIAADGSTIDVLLPPNLTDAQLTISDVTTDATNVVFAPQTALTVTTPAVPSFTGTTSNLAPAVNEAVTVTMGAGQTISPDATLLLGAGAPVITNLTPTAVTFIPGPGTTAQLVLAGVLLPEIPQIPLTLPAPITDTIKVSADVPEVAGTGDPGTAPSLLVPALGFNSVLFDNPATFDGSGFGFPTRWYKITLDVETILTVTGEWASGEDLGFYWFDTDGVTDLPFAPADAHGEGATASPETVTQIIPAGTYLIGVLNFSATNPPLMNITLTNETELPEEVRLASVRLYRKLGR